MQLSLAADTAGRSNVDFEGYDSNDNDGEQDEEFLNYQIRKFNYMETLFNSMNKVSVSVDENGDLIFSFYEKRRMLGFTAFRGQ